MHEPHENRGRAPLWWAVFALLLGLPLPALAAVPEAGEGTITLLAGLRGTPQHALLAEAQRDGQNPQHDWLQPGFLAELGFMAEKDFHVTIDLGYGLDSWHFSGGDGSVKVITLQLASDTPLWSGPRFTLYLGGGFGYSLNTFTRNGHDLESNSSSLFAKSGIRYALTDKVAWVAETRYTIASTSWPELQSNVNVGGFLFSTGLQFHFFEPQDKGHPGPGR